MSADEHRVEDRAAIPSGRLPTLRTERLVLRWLEAKDIEDLFSVFSDPEVMRYWSRPPQASLEDTRGLLEEIDQYFRSGSLYQWGIEHRGEGRILGTCTLAHIDRTHDRAEVGFALGRAAWGRGFMNEALEALIEHAFEHLHLHRLEADVDPRNERSIRCLERQGFEREGHLRERWYVQGERQDSVMFGLLAPHWRRRGAPPGSFGG